MELLTKAQFAQLPAGAAFATGTLPNTPEGLFMTNTGGVLRWVAVKGYANDWTIYCHWEYHEEHWIQAHGDKVTHKHHIKRCVPCEDEVFNLYRY